MGLVSSIGKFVARELARPLLEEVGKHIGDAIGTVIAKRIDPNHGDNLQDEDGESQGTEKRGGENDPTTHTHPQEG